MQKTYELFNFKRTKDYFLETVDERVIEHDIISRSSHQRCSIGKGRPATLLKKRLWHRCFPVNFVKFLRIRFLQNTSGRLLLN